MTLAEALSEGLKVTATGLIIVFSVLIILMIVMMIMKVVFYKENKPVSATPKTEPAETTVSASSEKDIEEGELIAVLTAAIAASLNTSTYNLNIKSYKRITNTSPAWNKAGLNDVIDARF